SGVMVTTIMMGSPARILNAVTHECQPADLCQSPTSPVPPRCDPETAGPHRRRVYFAARPRPFWGVGALDRVAADFDQGGRLDPRPPRTGPDAQRDHGDRDLEDAG